MGETRRNWAGLNEGVGDHAAGVRPDFQSLSRAWDIGDIPTESRAWERNWFGKGDDKLYRGHIELELSVGRGGQEVCSLGQVTQPLWASFFSFVKFPTICVAVTIQ